MSPLIPVLPETAPFTPEQRAWLNGFFAGLFSRGPTTIAHPAAAPSALVPLTILFGSQTGTAEGLAKRLAKEAARRGFAPTVLDMARADWPRLSGESNLLVLTSTYGDGEPPDNARPLHAALAAAAREKPAVAKTALRYAVCALGDRNYAQFCRCGVEFDTWLEQVGATRVAARADCDVDYETAFAAWMDLALRALVSGAASPAPTATAGAATASATSARAETPAPTYGRHRPYPAGLLGVRTLNGTGSAKQVVHIEFDLADSGLTYAAGDALAVQPQNCPELVAEILAALGWDGEEAVPAPDGTATSLRHALTEGYDLGRATTELQARFSPGSAGSGGVAVAALHVLDLVRQRADVRPSPVEFVRALRRLAPRLYSISSSPRAFPGQVHLTVGVVRYEAHGRRRKGTCSTFLAERTVPGTTRVGVHVHANTAFRPPASGDTPMIMIGPGTGIAPFRAFLQERRATGARGRNWLFFGDQHAATDFLYRDELETLQHDGLLTRFDTAFSRDQADKIYVQHRMLAQATELHAWLEAGAHLYVCGDASRMAKDVDAALHTAVALAGGKTTAEAADYVQQLKAAKRYVRDVY